MSGRGWSDSDEFANFGSFLLDKMHLQLDPKKVPYHDLVEVFKSQITEEHKDEFEEGRKGLNFLRQHRVNITPTLIKFTPGEEEESNRVIRNYHEKLPNFIRLCFLSDTDEKGYYFGGNAESLLGYVHSIMQNGFSLGKCRFQFLGYSNSQLKNHSCWFLCVNNPWLEITENEIVSYMGNFDKEKNILKKFARKGQCFSTSKLICELNKDQVTFGVEDIKRNDYCFTDGVGYISPELARKVAKDFRFSQVSAFQIRIAGAKGVLMEKKELQGEQVQLRNSQTKFPSDDLTLNVIRCSTFG